MPRSKHTVAMAAAVGVALIAATTLRARTPGGVPVPLLRAPSSGAADTLGDPALTVGTLPNGMRYYLRVNHAPAHRAELRLVVNAGSALEDNDQQGFAHFLEHMAFNGTTHFPRNTLIDYIETSGMRFGADLNASTSADETVYMLTLPTDDGVVLGKGLDVFQDWASGRITLDSSEVVAERGVVMGEWRMRLADSASQNVRAHYDSVLFGDSPYRTRSPIGDTTLIEHALPAPIRRYYKDWYRPDLMAIVVVGDFDRVAMLRQIHERFGSIPAAKTPRVRPVLSLPQSVTPVVDVYRGNVPPNVEVIWPAPRRPADSRAAERQQLVQDLLFQELQQRLLEIGERPSRPYFSAIAERGRSVRALNVVGVQVNAWPDSIARGLATVLTEVERVARNGIPSATLDHQKAVLLTHLEHAAASEGARASQAYANAYVQHYLSGDGSLVSAKQELAIAREILPSITPAVLAQAARFWKEPSGARVFIGIPQFAHVHLPTRASVLALFDSVAHAPLAPDIARGLVDAPLMTTLPASGTIVREQRDSAAGITEWTLSNGARVIVKPTQNDPDQLLLRAWSPGGFSVTPDSLFFTPGRMVARVMTEAGGVGATNHDALARELSTTGIRSMNVDIGFGDESIDLVGSPKERETLFQLLHLQFTAPTLDSAALAGWQSLAKYQGSGLSFDDQLNQTLAGGNPRMQPVSTDLAELATREQLLAVQHDRFGNAGDFTFTLVGAVTPEEVRPLVERYLASLPSTDKRETPSGEDARPFLHRVDQIVRTFEIPKAQTVLVFDGSFPSAPDAYLRERQRLAALSGVLQNRLRIRLREQLGGTYSPMISSRTYALPDEHYRVLFSFDAAPERMPQLNRELLDILDSVRTKSVSATEATQVTAVQQRQLETQLQNNAYWMSKIGEYNRLGIPLDKILTPYPEREVTPAEIEAAAKHYLPEDVYMHFTVMPRDSMSYARGDSTTTQ